MKLPFTKKTLNAFRHLGLGGKIALALFIALWAFILVICLLPVSNKEVLTPGVAASAASEITVNDGTTNIFTVGVYDKIGLSQVQYWIAQKEPAFALLDYTKSTDLSQAAEEKRGSLLKGLAEINAVIAAYDAAIAYESAQGLEATVSYTKTYQGLIVTAILPTATTTLDYGDVITAFAGEAVTSLSSFRTALKDALAAQAGAQVIPLEVTVLRDGKTLDVSLSARRVEGSLASNAYYTLDIEMYDYYTLAEGVTPAFSISSTSSYGSSGGAMLALSLYSSLLAAHSDITKGLLIAGTGTIDADGTIGEISGVAQKVRTFMLKNYQGIDVFYVPTANYDEAAATALAIKATFDVVGVASLTDILTDLAGREGRAS